MTTKKFLNNEEKRLMLEMRNQGVKVAQIASILKVKESTVYAALKRAKLRGTTDRSTGSGRPKKLSSRALRILKREREVNKNATLAELAASLPVKVHISTIRRALRKMA